jgi:glycosyl transferase family 87
MALAEQGVGAVPEPHPPAPSPDGRGGARPVQSPGGCSAGARFPLPSKGGGQGERAGSHREGARPWARPAGLLLLAILSLAGYIAIHPLSANGLRHPAGVAVAQLALAIPYALACWWVIASPPPQDRRVRRAEWIIVLGAALAFFAVVFPRWPSLSGDPYRYVWDARVLAHGYNPLALAPESPLLAHLRDGVIYPHIYWVHVPTIYPPAAQALYLLAYLVAPDNMLAIKAEMVVAVAATAALLIKHLRVRGQDPLRVIVCLWCPLVVVELGLDGHVDAAAIAVWLAALLLAERRKQPWARGAVGALLGVATLIKLYPTLFLLALGRRNDRWLYLAFGATLALGYLPFLQGGLPAFGFLGVYAGDTQSYGALLFWLRNLFVQIGVPVIAVQIVVAVVAALVAGGVVWARRIGQLAEGVALFILLALWLALTPHLLPWYVTALAPLCALYLRLPARDPGSILTASLWLGVCLMPAFNIAFDKAFRNLEWLYAAIYIAVAVCAVGGLLFYWLRHGASERRKDRDYDRSRNEVADGADATAAAARALHREYDALQ